MEFSYNNSYHSSSDMASFEALYGRSCRSPIGWFDLGEVDMFGPKLVYQAMEKVKVIRDRIKAVQSYQKSYVDVRNIDFEFEVEDMVFLKVSPMKGVVWFGKKGKLSPWYVGPYEILWKVGNVSYKLELPSILSLVHPIYNVEEVHW